MKRLLTTAMDGFFFLLAVALLFVVLPLSLLWFIIVEVAAGILRLEALRLNRNSR